MAQYLRLCASTTMGASSIPGWGTKIPPALWCRQKLKQIKLYWSIVNLRSGKWQPTSVFFPGESHGQRNLASCSPWGRKESDATSRLNNDSQRRAGTEWNGVCRVAARFWKPSINVPSLLTILILTTPIGSSPKHLFETYCVQIPCARCWRKELGWKCQLAKFIVFFLQACSPRNKITLQYLGHYNHTF